MHPFPSSPLLAERSVHKKGIARFREQHHAITDHPPLNVICAPIEI